MTLIRIFSPDGHESVEIEAPSGEKLSRAIWLSGKIAPAPLCDGLGLCGNCRVRFGDRAPQASNAEEKVFTPEELAAGWRLSCRQVVPSSPLELYLPTKTFLPYLPKKSATKSHAFNKDVVVGIDLGTTSIEWRAIETVSSRAVCWGQFLNPQAGAGADVISRLKLASAPGGAKMLADLASNALENIIDNLNDYCVKRICVAGNTAMTEILLGMDVSGLCAAPWRLSFNGNDVLAWPVGEGKIPMVIPPLGAPFVGGDTSACLMFLMKAGVERPLLLTDLGTNAEMALLCENNLLFLTSVPLGPAMEGIGPRCGQPAGSGVATSFSIGPSGFSPIPLSENITGMSATAYLSLLATLLRIGLLDRDGHFIKNPQMPLARKMASNIDFDGCPTLRLGHDLFITAEDVELLLKVKSAFSVAVNKLLRAADMAEKDIASVCLAGALGSHVAAADLEELGFFPPLLARRLKAFGNASLEGACILAKDPKKMEKLAKIVFDANVVNMTEDSTFLQEYLLGMSWSPYAGIK